jgi:hypothetical protein
VAAINVTRLLRQTISAIGRVIVSISSSSCLTGIWAAADEESRLAFERFRVVDVRVARERFASCCVSIGLDA